MYLWKKSVSIILKTELFQSQNNLFHEYNLKVSNQLTLLYLVKTSFSPNKKTHNRLITLLSNEQR